jgi:uncharacterized protein YqjF (DUF2071 family)
VPVERLRFADHLTPCLAPSGIDAVTRLADFAIITYSVRPERLRPLIHERFALDTIDIGAGERALLSVVPFRDLDFTAAAFPFPKFSFGQTNYRVYVRDRLSGEHCVWFIGTTLASWTVALPRYLWRLPWHAGRMRFDCELSDGRYTHYEMETDSRWAPASLQLRSVDAAAQHPGFPDEESAQVCLTHPLTGYYYRCDGTLGSYRVWHDQLELHGGEVLEARFGLLDRLGLVPFAEQAQPYSVLLQPETEFTIYLPPVAVSEKG